MGLVHRDFHSRNLMVQPNPPRFLREGDQIEFTVKVGDKVLISKYGGTEVKLDEKKYTLVREDDILGVLEK